MALEGTTLAELAGERTKTFKFVFTNGKQFFTEVFDFNRRIIENEYEWMLSVCEHIDEISNLKVGDSMYLNADRDCSAYKGVIIRLD